MQSLRRRRDIHRVFQEGTRVYAPWAVMHARRRETAEGPPEVRLGVIASKRVGGAVARNRARRVLREASRRLLGHSLARWDVLFVARPEVLGTEFEERLRVLGEMFGRAGITVEASCTP